VLVVEVRGYGDHRLAERLSARNASASRLIFWSRKAESCSGENSRFRSRITSRIPRRHSLKLQIVFPTSVA
jgi:hypothetical protein